MTKLENQIIMDDSMTEFETKLGNSTVRNPILQPSSAPVKQVIKGTTGTLVFYMFLILMTRHSVTEDVGAPLQKL